MVEQGEGIVLLRMTHPLRSGPRTPSDVQREGVARLFEVSLCVVAVCGETSAVEAGQTKVDAQRVVLRQATEVSEGGTGCSRFHRT